MFTFTWVDFEYESNITSWDIWNYDRILIIALPSFQLATRSNSQNT